MSGKSGGFKGAIPVLVTVAIASFMVQLDVSIVNIALPTITEEMSSTTSETSRIVLYYMLAIVSSLLLFGRIGDHIGKKPVFIWGYVVFSLSSVLCGLSGSLGMLTAMRMLQGLGGAMLFATLSAIIIQNIPKHFQGRAFGLLAIFASIGLAAGAPIGGLIVSTIGWRWIFYLNVIPGTLGVLLSLRNLKNDPATYSGRKDGLDIPGVLLSSTALFAFVIAMNSGSVKGWTSPLIILLLTASVCSMTLFIIREKRTPRPLLELDMFRTRQLTSGLLTRVATTAIMNGSLILFPFFLEKVMEMSTMHTGLLIGIFPLILLLVGPLSGILADKLGAGRISLIGSVIMLGAVVLFAVFRFTESMALVIGGFTVFGLGVGLFFPANMKLVMGYATRGREGILSAVNSLSSFLGAVLGVALLESIFSLGFPSVHDYTTLPAQSVSSGFGHAMFASIALALISVVYSLWVIGKAAPPPSGKGTEVQEVI